MMVDMNPFDAPPSGPAASFDPPVNAPADRPRRGRMALVALLAAGLAGGGIVGVSQLANADRPEVAAATPTTVVDETADETPETTTDETPETTTDETTGEATDDSTQDPSTEPAATSDEQPTADVNGTVDGEIVLDFGSDEPIVIDLGDLDDGTLGRLGECIGFPAFDFDFDVWGAGEHPVGDDLFGDFPFPRPGDFAVFDSGGSVTVTGPDGVSVVDLGEEGSVTITKQNGEITVEPSGDATVSDLAEVFGDFGSIFEGLPDFEPPDPAVVQACIDEVLGN